MTYREILISTPTKQHLCKNENEIYVKISMESGEICVLVLQTILNKTIQIYIFLEKLSLAHVDPTMKRKNHPEKMNSVLFVLLQVVLKDLCRI